MVSNEIMLKIENVSKVYKLGEIGGTTLRDELQRLGAKIRKKEDPTKKVGTKNYNKGEKFKALDNVSFEVKKGERIGIIGHNGAGKSTLLKLISRVTGPSEGTIYLNGRVTSMLEVGTGFHPELTGRENVYMNGAILGMTKKEIDAKMEDIIEFSEVRQFIDTPVKRYSSGMYVKLAFSVAAHLDSEIMIMDEVLAVGDMAFQAKCLDKMRDVSEQDERTILYVSHNMDTIRKLCNRVIVLKEGSIIYNGDVDSGIEKYVSSKHIMVSKYDLSCLERTNKSITKNVFLTRVSLLNENQTLDDSGIIKLKLDMVVRLQTMSVIKRLIICNADGTPLATIHSNKKNYAQGTCSELLTINLRNLAPGEYCFKIVLFTPLGQNVQLRHDSVENIAYFFVKDNYINGLKWQGRYWGRFIYNLESDVCVSENKKDL